MKASGEKTRENEWYVPSRGSRRFRLLIGLSFYPYTLMNATFVLIGSLLAPTVHVDRMVGMALVYMIAVGVSAHSLDAMAPNKPWGDFLSRTQLLSLAVVGLVVSLLIGLYYALTFAPILLPLGLLELFFLLAYNMELFGGRFHNDYWFALSWGFLPVLAGFMVQTDSITLTPVGGGAFGFFASYIEIKASRPYKDLKKNPSGNSSQLAGKFESILKGVVASVFTVCGALILLRFFG